MNQPTHTFSIGYTWISTHRYMISIPSAVLLLQLIPLLWIICCTVSFLCSRNKLFRYMIFEPPQHYKLHTTLHNTLKTINVIRLHFLFHAIEYPTKMMAHVDQWDIITLNFRFNVFCNCVFTTLTLSLMTQMFCLKSISIFDFDVSNLRK